MIINETYLYIFEAKFSFKGTYRIFSIKRRTPIKRRPRLNVGSKLLIFK